MLTKWDQSRHLLFTKRTDILTSCVLSIILQYCYLQVFIMKLKTEVPKSMKEALRFLQAKFPGAGQFYIRRVDNGSEFICEATDSILDEFAIVPELAEPGYYEHNGTAERVNRTIQERERALLFEAVSLLKCGD